MRFRYRGGGGRFRLYTDPLRPFAGPAPLQSDLRGPRGRSALTSSTARASSCVFSSIHSLVSSHKQTQAGENKPGRKGKGRKTGLAHTARFAPRHHFESRVFEQAAATQRKLRCLRITSDGTGRWTLRGRVVEWGLETS